MDNLTKTALAKGSYVAYTDGSCKGNPGPGAAAYRLYSPDGVTTENTRESLSTTNNIAEMWAVIDALNATPKGASVMVCLDSGYIKDNFDKYVRKWCQNGWRKTNGKAVLNRELWERIIELTDERTVTFRKVKAHSGDTDNDYVDSLASTAAERAHGRAFIALQDAS